MRNTNRLTREWLFQNGYDFIWLKPHMDSRKSRFKDFYHTTQGAFYSQDIYNLFDGICFDKDGRLTFLQLSTTNFHPTPPYQDFIRGKTGFAILMIKAVKAGNRWQIRTKDIRCPAHVSISAM